MSFISQKLSTKLIINDTKKSRLKFKAIQAFESGSSVSTIARQTGKSRLTIYRWLHQAHQSLSQRKQITSKDLDTQSANRVIEMYVLLKKPSIKKLSQAISDVFSLKIHPAKLRRFIIKRGLENWKPSPLFDLVRQSLVSERSDKNV